MKIDLKKNKTLMSYAAITILLEIFLILLLKGSGARMSLLAGMVSIPMALIIVSYMFKSLENAIIASVFCIPILPLVGYIMLRLNLLEYQWVIYVIFYLLSGIALLKNQLFKQININNLKVKNKVIRIMLALLLIVNCFFAYNKKLSIMIILFSFVPFAIYMLIIKTIDVKDKSIFLDKVLFAVSLGCLVSSIPDIVFFVIYWIQGNRGQRGFGPLTGNYILMYDLIILVIALNKVSNKKQLNNKWNIILVGILFIISTQISRGAFFSFIAIMVAYILFDFKNIKIYIPILLVIGSLMGYNVMNRPDVANDQSLVEIKDIISKDEAVTEENQELDIGSSTFGDVLLKIVNSQSKTRQAIWKASIGITQDYPYTGVGIGNLQFFFDKYTTGKKGYTDAHNFMLNLSSELGLPFMIISMLLLFFSACSEFYRYFVEKNKRIKSNRLAIVIICGVIFLYGNLTGIALQLTNEIYSFTATFILLFVLLYRDLIEEI